MDAFNAEPRQKPSAPQRRFDEDYLKSRLEPIVKEPIARVEIFALQGDASDRRYFRVHYFRDAAVRGAAEKSAVIVMQQKEPTPEQESDFNRIQKFLARLKMPVPKILHHDTERGLLFLEDGGDTHLADLARTSPDSIVAWYQKAIELIVSMQTRVTKNIQPHRPVGFPKFDGEKLMWEMDFMMEHYVTGFLRRKLSREEKSEIRAALLGLCKTLAAEEQVFTHRDFHSRNLIVREENLMLIDFQDARMGPRQYDLVSLLKDSYVVLKEETRDELLGYYLQRMEQEEGRRIPRSPFRKVFDWMSVQRNLKAIGTFAFQYMEHKNDRYLEYIDPTLRYIRDTLHSRPDLEPLCQTLQSAIPKLNASGGEISRP